MNSSANKNYGYTLLLFWGIPISETPFFLIYHCYRKPLRIIIKKNKRRKIPVYVLSGTKKYFPFSLAGTLYRKQTKNKCNRRSTK